MVTRIDSFEDKMKRLETYELDDGQRICFESEYVKHVGLAKALRAYGVTVTGERLPVYQRGQQIGTLPAIFDAARIKRTSMFYEPRSGDFTRNGDRWEACPTLGPGDLEAVPEFVFQRMEGK